VKEAGSRWPKASTYRVRGGVIRPYGAVSYYRPEDIDKLPFEIAKLADGDDGSLTEFARRWGLFGYGELQRRIAAQLLPPGYYGLWGARSVKPGEPVEWVLTQAQNLRLCAATLKDLDDGHGLADAIRSYFEATEGSYWTLFKDPAAVLDGTLTAPLPTAKLVVENIISDHTSGITERFLFENGGRVSYGFTAMIEVAYLHMRRHFEKTSPVGECADCGAFFAKTHGLQRYCPPDSDEAESRCSYRQRYKRVKAKGGRR
jgi:hypothetical protein